MLIIKLKIKRFQQIFTYDIFIVANINIFVSILYCYSYDAYYKTQDKKISTNFIISHFY